MRQVDLPQQVVDQAAFAVVGDLALAAEGIVGRRVGPLFRAEGFQFPVVAVVFIQGLDLRRLRFRFLRLGRGLPLVALEDRVGIEHFLYVLAQFDAVQLQQFDGLLQLRGQCQLLCKS